MKNHTNTLPFQMFYNIDIPVYLQKTYWWAYIHPKAVKYDNVTLCLQNSTALNFTDDSYENVVVFFLLHEQSVELRKKNYS